MKYEKITKHEAILKASSILGPDNVKPSLVVKKAEISCVTNDPESLSRIAVLTKIFSSFLNGMSRSQPGRQYAVSRGLDPERLDIGFNSGQYHHNGKVSDELMKSFIKYGLLKPIGKGTHQVFGKNCICFTLKNPSGQVTGLYFRSISETNGNKDQSRHFYLKDRQGLFPSYPKPNTIKLILTEAIIDAATLLLIDEITKEYGILSLYGTNGLTDEHKKAIGDLKELQEIILFLDGDLAGREAVKKHSETLHTLKPGIKISYVETPDSHDVNSLYTSHEREIFTHLLQSRKTFSFSIETVLTEKTSTEKKKEPIPDNPSTSGKLDTTNPYNILYQGELARYSIRGGLRSDMDSLKVSIVIESLKQAGPYMKYRNKADLYENRQVEKIAREAADKLDVRADLVELDMHHLTDLLEDYGTLFMPTEKKVSANRLQKPIRQ